MSKTGRDLVTATHVVYHIMSNDNVESLTKLRDAINSRIDYLNAIEEYHKEQKVK